MSYLRAHMGADSSEAHEPLIVQDILPAAGVAVSSASL